MGAADGTEAAEASDTVESTVEPDSSPMVERPVDEEPAIAETQPAEEPQPATPKRRRRSKAAAESEVTVTQPAPAEAAPAETAEQAAAPEKPVRKRRAKKAEAAPADEQQETAETSQPETAADAGPQTESVPVPPANNDTAEEPTGEPRRGWWQRTFG